MSPLDWLRAKTKQKPKAGALDLREPIDDELEQLAEQLEAILTPLLGPASHEQTQRIADAKAAQVREEIATMNCPCIAIYSRCYYGH
jgi:hypothetical protein